MLSIMAEGPARNPNHSLIEPWIFFVIESSHHMYTYIHTKEWIAAALYYGAENAPRRNSGPILRKEGQQSWSASSRRQQTGPTCIGNAHLLLQHLSITPPSPRLNKPPTSR